MSCSSFFKLTTVKVVVLALFIIVNVLLYTQSKYVLLETVFHSNRSSTPHQSFNSKLKIINPQLLASSHNSSLNNDDIFDYKTHRAHLTHGLTFLKEPIINPHKFRYKIKPNVTCSDRQIELVICVIISQDNDVGRSVIRNTWGSYAYEATNKAILVFFIGSNDKKHETEQQSGKNSKIQEEASVYGDILQEDYIDSYENLSLKSVSVLKWVDSFCPNTKFILKVDDDMYVNIPFLMQILRKTASDESTPNAFVMGCMQVNAEPIRNPSSKWYTSFSMFSGDKYPNYVSGTAYAMTNDAAVLLYEASLRVKRFWLEDVYITGFCSKKAGVEVINSGYFTYSKPATSGCSFRAHVSGHRYTHKEIEQIHKELNDRNLWCWL